MEKDRNFTFEINRSLAISKDVYELIVKLASKKGKTKKDLVEEAVKLYAKQSKRSENN